MIQASQKKPTKDLFPESTSKARVKLGAALLPCLCKQLQQKLLSLCLQIFWAVRGKIRTAALNECFFSCQGQKSGFFRGMIIPHSIGNPYWIYKPTIGFFEHPLWKQLEFRLHHIWRWCNIFSIFSPFYLEKLKNLKASVSPFEGGLSCHENQVNWPQNWHLKTCILNCMKYETTPQNINTEGSQGGTVSICQASAIPPKKTIFAWLGTDISTSQPKGKSLGELSCNQTGANSSAGSCRIWM